MSSSNGSTGPSRALGGDTDIGNRCCIVGGGPAGVMLGYLLARIGVPVVVLEKHADFFRDFRGDTVHPSTLNLLSELGLLERFLARPHQEFPTLSARIDGIEVRIADFTRLPTAAKFLVVMPQWDFLNFLTSEAARFPAFSILMNTEMTGLIEEDGVVRGVRVTGTAGAAEIPARLVIGADGRTSRTRALAGLSQMDVGAPIDVLWFRLPRHADDGEQPLGQFRDGRILVQINRGDYFQCGFVIPKGAFAGLKAGGLGAFRTALASVAPQLADRTVAITSWDDVKLLTVSIDRLRTWHKPGLLCIGDAAHAMSPIGGVGINLAVQDAVATANLLGGPLSRREYISPEMLAAVEQRRRFPTCATQRLQVVLQRVVIRALGSRTSGSLPLPFRLLRRFPLLQRIPARIVGLGFRPEHVQPLPAASGANHQATDGGPT